MSILNQPEQAQRPGMLARSIALMKPVTWFPPTWAFLWGAVASGGTTGQLDDVVRIIIGMIMAGPILCGLSQVINDYCDREVDAINEPDRLIPSGQISLTQVMVTIIALIVLGLAIGFFLGGNIPLLVVIGLFLAIAYSAPPLRAKRNGWYGNALAAISYEGLAWLAGHLTFAALTPASVLIAVLYSFGTHGIMSINDYKSIDGDRASGINSIPVLYGPKRAAWLIVITMNLAQVGVIAAFLAWGQPLIALFIAGILAAQLPLQRQFLRHPMDYFLKFSAFGVLIFVLGMPIAAFGLRAL
ncbi:MAG: chlorophyll synthase ChlG [Chloroflexi bacterium]|nr:chlorophyll synthase ChlG [Chloroflexota bacterium]